MTKSRLRPWASVISELLEPIRSARQRPRRGPGDGGAPGGAPRCLVHTHEQAHARPCKPSHGCVCTISSCKEWPVSHVWGAGWGAVLSRLRACSKLCCSVVFRRQVAPSPCSMMVIRRRGQPGTAGELMLACLMSPRRRGRHPPATAGNQNGRHAGDGKVKATCTAGP